MELLLLIRTQIFVLFSRCNIIFVLQTLLHLISAPLHLVPAAYFLQIIYGLPIIHIRSWNVHGRLTRHINSVSYNWQQAGRFARLLKTGGRAIAWIRRLRAKQARFVYVRVHVCLCARTKKRAKKCSTNGPHKQWN